jgi:hypothetical protein
VEARAGSEKEIRREYARPLRIRGDTDRGLVRLSNPRVVGFRKWAHCTRYTISGRSVLTQTWDLSTMID